MTLTVAKNETSRPRETGYPKVTLVNTDARLSLCRDGVELLLHVHRRYGDAGPEERWKSTLESSSIPYTSPELLALARELVCKCEEAQGTGGSLTALHRQMEAGLSNL